MATTTLVVSPHLDDAVLSCGHLLLTRPGAVVVTVMAGNPGPGVLSDWDRGCGFTDGDDPVARRREEDRRALVVVGATPRHLGFLDLPYRRPGIGTGDHGGAVTAPDALAANIAAALREEIDELRPGSVLIPLGLLHPDHELTHEAGTMLMRSAAGLSVWAYQDLPYGLAHPQLVAARLERLGAAGIEVREVVTAPPAQPLVKREAVACYASQVESVTLDLGREAWEGTFAAASERFWRLTVAG